MSRTSVAIAARFQKILERSALSTRDLDLYGRHRQSVVDALVASGVLVNNLHRIGSFERGTAIRNVSDIDLLVIVKRREVTWGDDQKSSNTVLSNFRTSLRGRFPNTEIGRDGQAVVVQYGDGTHPVDVVPGYYERHGGPYNHPIFSIPNGTGGWMETSPSTHNRYIAEADARSGHHLVGLAQIFKYWCATRAGGVPISGFYVEMRMAAEDLGAGVRTYSQKFCDLLVMLAEKQCAALNDPLGLSGRIAACGTEAKRRQALATLLESVAHARAAVRAEASEDFDEAWRQWNMVFNDQFPREGA